MHLKESIPADSGEMGLLSDNLDSGNVAPASETSCPQAEAGKPSVCPQNADVMPRPPQGTTGWPWTEQCDALPEVMPDGRPWPKISIVTPSYNQGEFIEETIRSVLLQGYPNLEYIIIDGGSTDGSVEIIKKYKKHFTYWVSEADRGQSHAINKGFKHATGELFGWLNSDDYYLPGALAAVAKTNLDAGKSCAVVGIGRAVDCRGRTLFEQQPSQLDYESVLECKEHWIYQPTCFFPAESYWSVGGLDEQLHYAMDFDLFVKLSKRVPFVQLDRCIAVALCHPAAKTKRARGKMFAEVRLIQMRNGGEQYALEALEYNYTKLLWFENLARPLKTNFLYRLFRRRLKRSIFGGP